jgi:hypothetical protein
MTGSASGRNATTNRCPDHTARPLHDRTVAARRLMAIGYTNVREYAEGKEDRVNAGLPVERGAVTPVR